VKALSSSLPATSMYTKRQNIIQEPVNTLDYLLVALCPGKGSSTTTHALQQVFTPAELITPSYTVLAANLVPHSSPLPQDITGKTHNHLPA
jgi:hypothetical protein